MGRGIAQRIGGALVIFGFGSVLLSAFNAHFVILAWMDDAQPWAGIVMGLAGVAVFAAPFLIAKNQQASGGQAGMPGQPAMPGHPPQAGFGPQAGPTAGPYGQPGNQVPPAGPYGQPGNPPPPQPAGPMTGQQYNPMPPVPPQQHMPPPGHPPQANPQNPPYPSQR